MAQALLSSTLFLLGAAMSLAQPCNSSSTALCLSAGRFEVTVAWTDFQGNHGDGQAIPLTADTGYFWFFTNTNVELVVKVLDARAINGHFWVFYGALSNVHYEITVRDSQTGDVQVYDNPSGQFASTGDTLAFPPSATVSHVSTESRAADRAGRLVGQPVDETRVAPAEWNSAAACAPGATALCLSGGRFRVEAAWKDFQGHTGVGQAVGLTSDTGYFWFFSNTNVEAVIKVLDARPINNHFWVFYGALSNVEYTMTVTDTVTGIVHTYKNPSGLFASVGDTLAFGPPTTFQLIDGGVVKGEIDAETALLYKVYAFFGDPRLPQAYRGDPPGDQGHGILSDVANSWSTLSSHTQQALQPFLTPPNDPASWFAQAPASSGPVLERRTSPQDQWAKISTSNTWIWYRPADAGAQSAANNLAAEAETVWKKETGLMQKEPVDDSNIKAAHGVDGKYDIYVLPGFSNPRDKDADGVLTPYPEQPSDQPRAAYTLIRASAAATPEGARAVLAHEFFHAIAAAFKNGLNGWLNEATATWMEDYVYPTQILDVEHLEAGKYLTGGYKVPFDQLADDYQDYLFLFYLHHSISAEINHQIWINVETMGSLDAIQAAIPGGFAAQWPQFALDCWDQPEVDSFNRWDHISTGLVEGNADPYLGLASDGGSDSLPSQAVDHLAMNYVFIDVVNDSLKRLEIQNRKAPPGTANVKRKAWMKLADGTTRIEDWSNSDKDRVVFCRDKASQHVTKVMILYTNSNQNAPVVWDEGKVSYDTIGCGYHGTVHLTRHEPDGSFDETIDTEATLLHMQGADYGNSVIYAAAKYTVRYKGTQQASGCTDTIGPVTQTFAGSNVAASLITFDTSSSPAGYSAQAPFFMQATETEVCPWGTTQRTSAAVGLWWDIPAGLFKVKPDGSLADTYTDGSRIWKWNFQPDVGDDGP